MPKAILLVEDNEDDVFFLTRAFKSAGLISPLLRVEDGQKAIDYLSGKPPYDDRAQFPLPALLLLDLKMPFLSGFDVLHWVRSESICPRLPVVVFTTSNQERDIERSYELGANAYLMKPAQADQCEELAHLLKRFWLEVNLTPPAGRIEAGRPEIVPSRSDKSGA